MAVTKRGEAYFLRIRPFGRKEIGVKTSANSKREAKRIEIAGYDSVQIRRLSIIGLFCAGSVLADVPEPWLGDSARSFPHGPDTEARAHPLAGRQDVPHVSRDQRMQRKGTL